MTQIETIIAEIERRYNQNRDKLTKLPEYCDEAYHLQRICSEERFFIDFINSLPAEQPREELNKEIDSFLADNVGKINNVGQIARHFAQWQKEQTINKACEWLNKNVVEYHPRTGELKHVVNLNAFREAMEDEQ